MATALILSTFAGNSKKADNIKNNKIHNHLLIVDFVIHMINNCEYFIYKSKRMCYTSINRINGWE